MALYKGNVKLAGIGKSFSPENCGCNGQVLTKTSTGYAYCDIDIPEYSDATESCHGLMSASDKKKLDGIFIHKIRYVIVGGGGGGGGFRGGGGGGGEIKTGSVGGFNNQYNITIGAAGVGGCACGNCQFRQATGGGNTSLQNDFSGETITAKGGCGGCNGYWDTSYGCYRGGAGGASGSGCAGGSGSFNIAGGGGGATGAGCDYCSYNVSVGGLGICGFGGGGEPSASCYGRCGGGKGGTNYESGGTATNYGGGGGGGGHCNSAITGGNGCQGVIDVCYPTDGSWYFTCATGGTKTTVTEGGVTYYRHRFTSNGTFCIVC